MSYKRRDLYVFAGSYAEAVRCVRLMGWDTDNWAYLAEAKVLDGTVSPDVAYTGSFMTREDREEIEQTMDYVDARRVLVRLVTKVTEKRL